MYLIEETLINARAKAAKLLEKHESVIFAVDFKNQTVQEVLPVVKDKDGNCTNEKELIKELKKVNCQPRPKKNKFMIVI